MRVLHVSDIHCSYLRLEKLLKVEEYDLVVVSGDLECEGAIEVLSHHAPKVIAVPGNMDDRYIAELLEESGISVDGKIVERGGFTFLGVGGLDHRRSFERAVEALRAHGKPPHVVVSHLPPKGTRVDKALGVIHAGSAHVRSLVEKWKPKLVLCGHIHEARGTDRIGETLVVNAGPLASNGSYAIVDLETLKVELKALD